jgi:PTS system fructose-specific IIC component
MISQLTGALQDAGPLLILALVILAGGAMGEIARLARLPSITGQILAGLLMGKAGLDLFADESLEGLQPLTHFALGLIAVTVGAHLNIRRLRNAGRRLFFLLLTESIMMPAVVFLTLWLAVDIPVTSMILLAAVAIATAPATVVSLVKETRSKGVFVKTLIAAVALNNMACIFAFEVARAVTRDWQPGNAGGAGFEWHQPLYELLIALAIGGSVAVTMHFVSISRISLSRQRLATAAAAALVLTTGLAFAFDVSPLLACLFLGFIQTNITPTRSHLVDSLFADFEPAILTIFFTLAGLHVSFEHAGVAGVTAALFFGARIVGKLVAANSAMRMARAPQKMRENLGLALIPQAGVAVGLVLVLQEDAAFATIAPVFSAVVLTAVTANEIIGPILTRYALVRAGEVNRDRVRLIDFLQEENIVTDFRARTKEVAIEKMVDLMLATHEMRGVNRQEFLESVLAREEEASTCLGGGLSVPHGILPDSHPLVGVMALSREGLDFESPDSRPIHCMVMLGTSEQERDRHLQVLASLARTVGTDPVFQDQLFNAESPAHASEILHGEESEDFNYFLEED